MDGIFGKKNNSQEKKLRNEIENTEFKKQSLISAVDNEIRATLTQRENEYNQIGKLVYEKKEQDSFSNDENLVEIFSRIDNLNRLLEQKKEKIDDIRNKYDDEINMLNSMLPQSKSAVQITSSNQPPGNGQAFCLKCNTGYTLGEDLFCTSCGGKL